MKHGCTGKADIIGQLDYMMVYAPNFPAEDEMTLDHAFATVEYGFARILAVDGRPEIADGIARARSQLSVARGLFDAGSIVPACHKLQEVEDILRPLKVKAEVQ